MSHIETKQIDQTGQPDHLIVTEIRTDAGMVRVITGQTVILGSVIVIEIDHADGWEPAIKSGLGTSRVTVRQVRNHERKTDGNEQTRR